MQALTDEEVDLFMSEADANGDGKVRNIPNWYPNFYLEFLLKNHKIE